MASAKALRFVVVLVTVCTLVQGRWIDDSKLETETLSQTPTPLPQYTLNLDLPPEERWKDIISLPRYKNASSILMDYLTSNVPKWTIPIIDEIGKHIVSYFGEEFGGEMKGVAEAYGAPIEVGTVVALNLVYQLESLGTNCSR